MRLTESSECMESHALLVQFHFHESRREPAIFQIAVGRPSSERDDLAIDNGAVRQFTQWLDDVGKSLVQDFPIR
jgi:hypothetical protein